ncbi:flagellar motor protein MotB [Vibrio mimicus]
MLRKRKQDQEKAHSSEWAISLSDFVTYML